MSEGRRGRMFSQSVLAQFGDGSGGRNLGEQKEITTGTWSEPVDGRGVSHLLIKRKNPSPLYIPFVVTQIIINTQGNF